MPELKLKDLKDVYIEELKDLYSAEKQICASLPKMASSASDGKLKEAFQSHLRESEEQAKRLERLCADLNVTPTGHKCHGMEGLTKEGAEFCAAKGDDAARDAGLIAAAQRIEHYEMAGYGSARAHAETLGLEEHARVLQTTLDEEKATDSKLNDIAYNLNPMAGE